MERVRIRFLSKTEAGVEAGETLLTAFNNHLSSSPSTPSKWSTFLFKIASTGKENRRTWEGGHVLVHFDLSTKIYHDPLLKFKI